MEELKNQREEKGEVRYILPYEVEDLVKFLLYCLLLYIAKANNLRGHEGLK